MESTYASLTNHLISLPSFSRTIVAIAGIAGSGKSTLSQLLMDRVNCHFGEEVAVVVGMDGFHLPRSTLDSMADPAEAHRRRGAPFTFDSEGFVRFVRRLTEEPEREWRAPGFDHAVGDPVEDAITVRSGHRIILLEGLYLLLNQQPWDQIAPLCTETWFLDVSMEIARDRVARRHFEAGLVDSLDAGVGKWESNDLLNARTVLDNLIEPTLFFTIKLPR